MNTNVLAHAIFVGLLMLTVSAHSVSGVQAPAPGAAEETAVAGCLQTVADTDRFVLVAEDKQTYQVQAAETVELAPHANHRVELTGTVEKTDASIVRKATALKMMASSCEA